MSITDSILILWDYLNLQHPLRKADVIIGFGSYDTSTAERAARLYLDGWAPVILFSGGLGKGTEGFFAKTEADTYAEIAMQYGIPKDDILIENRSTNSGENIIFSKELLHRKGISAESALIVHKPYMGRRVYATIRKQWSVLDTSIAPCDTSFDDHRNHFLANGGAEDEIIHSMVGDFQRIGLFAEKGYQIPQPISQEALDAYAVLVNSGYTKYVI